MAEEITEDNFEKLLLKRHPKLMSEQPKQDLEDNFDIMAKKMTKDQIESLSEMENAVGKPGLITDSITERKNKYEPEIYGKKEKFISDLMVFGIQCGKGWFYLIDSVMDLIENHVEKIEEVKEKYGTLRIYLYGDDYANAIAERAENLSEVICETCGKQITQEEKYENNKNHVEGSWIFTRCSACMVDPQKDFPMSKNHVKKEEIKNYLTNDKIYYTKVKDLVELVKENRVNDKLIISMKGEIVKENTDYFFNDDTGKILIRNDDKFTGKVEIINCYLVKGRKDMMIDYSTSYFNSNN
jgi:hypothetical protein